jgi:hypothetical protein
VYDDDDIEQLLFEADGEIVGYAECASFMIEQLQHLARLRMHAHRARSG